jgi:hypothetical protein
LQNSLVLTGWDNRSLQSSIGVHNLLDHMLTFPGYPPTWPHTYPPTYPTSHLPTNPISMTLNFWEKWWLIQWTWRNWQARQEPRVTPTMWTRLRANCYFSCLKLASSITYELHLYFISICYSF